MLEVLYLSSSTTKFAWQDGYFAIINELNGMYHICRIVKGKLEKDSKGSYEITYIGTHSKDIQRTNLMYNGN